MQISFQKLKEFFTDYPLDASKTAELLTDIGLEVESIEPFESVKGGLHGLVIGQVLTCEKHPNADKLSKTTVDVGNNTVLPIVCGASNVAAGQKVVVATVGATVHPTQGEPFTIKKAKIRGEESEGMICAEDEIGLGSSHEGIMVLNTDLPNGTSASQYFGIASDDIITIGLTPNRADAASHYGVARDLYAALAERLGMGIELKKPDVTRFNTKETSFKPQLEVKNKLACPHYQGVVIADLQVKPSPAWLQNFLKSIGVNPINNVVDVTNYVLHELGQPLHAFDWNKVKGGKIVVRNALPNETLITLDGKTRKLNPTDLMICDEKDPMCIAGIFGGTASGVTENTTSIFLESAYFSPESIRKTANMHGLKTDASFRYERGTDPHVLAYAMKRAAILLQEIAGGHVASDIVTFYPEKIEPFTIWMEYEYIYRMLGSKIPASKIFGILDALETKISDETKEGFLCTVPNYRVDVTRPADIVEEIVRIYGYNHLPTSAHAGATYLAPFENITTEKVQNTLANLLAAKGFNEIFTNSLTRPDYAGLAGLKLDNNVILQNPLSPELSSMRQHMLFSGLEAIVYNFNRRNKDLKFFEFGNTYQLHGENHLHANYSENAYLALYVTGAEHSETWQGKAKMNDVFFLKSMVEQLLTSVGIKNLNFKEITNSKVFSYGLCIEWNKKTVVEFGLVNAAITKAFDIKPAVWYAQLHMEWVLNHVSNRITYEEISKFPEVRRDLSLVLDKKIAYTEIEKIAYKTERDLLKNMEVFDVYEGDKIAADKKAYAIAFTLQDTEQTLTDKQIDNTMQRLIKAFENQLSATIRS